jgi:hypothetical protein
MTIIAVSVDALPREHHRRAPTWIGQLSLGGDL